MRALSKLLIIAHIPLILLAFLLRFTIVDALSHLETNDSFAILAGALLVLFFCYLAVVAFLTEVYFAYYTYKNLFFRSGLSYIDPSGNTGATSGSKSTLRYNMDSD